MHLFKCSSPLEGVIPLPGNFRPYEKPRRSASITHKASCDSACSIDKPCTVDQSSHNSSQRSPPNCLVRRSCSFANVFQLTCFSESPGVYFLCPAKSSAPCPWSPSKVAL